MKKCDKSIFDEKFYKAVKDIMDKREEAVVGLCQDCQSKIKIIDYVCYCGCRKCFDFINKIFKNHHPFWNHVRISLRF